MHLKYRIPLNLLLHSPTPESLTAQTSFSYRGCLVSVTILGENSELSDPPSPEHRYYLHGESLQLVMVEGPNGGILRKRVSAPDYTGLLTLLHKAVNRCLKAIWNFGIVPLVHELPPEDNEHARELLQHWGIEISDDGVEWEGLVEPQTLGEALRYRSSAVQTSVLDARKWVEIQEAIQDQLSPPPEQEFTINALEHLHVKNFRLALLEAVIGLEIVLSRFLRKYLEIHKGISKTRIEDFVSPQFTLYTRISGVLNLTLPADDLRQINLDRVITAINWRNRVVHKTGHIRDGFTDSQRSDVIFEVLELTHLLAIREQQISASPAIQSISTDIRKRYRYLPPPTIKVLNNHQVLVTFQYVFPKFNRKIPARDRLETVVRGYPETELAKTHHLFDNWRTPYWYRSAHTWRRNSRPASRIPRI